MGDCKIVGSNIRHPDQVIDEWHIRVAHNLSVAVILHHDHPDMIQMWNPRWRRSFRGERAGRAQKNTSTPQLFHLCNAFPFTRVKAGDVSPVKWKTLLGAFVSFVNLL